MVPTCVVGNTLSAAEDVKSVWIIELVPGTSSGPLSVARLATTGSACRTEPDRRIRL
jgi:hypothetical protein